MNAKTASFRPVAVGLRPLFEASWAYAEFIRIMPFGPASEGQAYAYSKPARVHGEELSGSLRLVQYPRWRADGTLLPDLHGIIETNSGERVAIRAAGYALRVADRPEARAVTHWMRFWTETPDLVWLNSTLAIGSGFFDDEEARIRYYAARPRSTPSDMPSPAPALELLGTANWHYLEYAAVRPFGDNEGVGYSTSTGEVRGGSLEGSWRGWHYPTYLRNGLYQIDAHAEISGVEGPILNRHGGLATQPPGRSVDILYEVAQHATFFTAIPSLAYLNNTLAVGVGLVNDTGEVMCSYYSVAAR